MYKKIGISLLLAFAMLISVFNVGMAVSVSTAPCESIAECRELQREAQDNIAEMIEEEEETAAKISELQDDISALRDRIAVLEGEISILSSELALLGIEIIELADQIEENLGILVETEAHIDVLMEEVAQRMRVAQRTSNVNSFLVILSEAESLTDIVRRMRTFNRMAVEDAEIMDELNELVEFHGSLLLELDEQRAQLETDRSEHKARRAGLELQQDDLLSKQMDLGMLETEMQDHLYSINAERVDEEGRLAALEAAQEILERTPPPSVNTSAPPGDLGSTSNSGMINPLPGSIVTSEFGPRGGRPHTGIDLIVPGNPTAPIVAAASGTVTFSGYEAGGFGWYMIVAHEINGQRVDTLYAHLHVRSPIEPGTTVTQGEVIGTKGNTGWSTGPHLHFEVHPGGISWGPNRGVNPRNWVNF